MAPRRQYKLLHCPRCGADSTVDYARGTAAGTFRRRSCAECSLEFCTEERVLGIPERRHTIPGSLIVEAFAAAGLVIDWTGCRPQNEA